jgi:hypothetical protein
MNKRGSIILGAVAAVVVAGLMVLEHFNAKDGTVAYRELVEVTPSPPIGGFTIVRVDPEKLVPVIRANIAGTPDAVRLAQVAREFATAEGFSLQEPGARLNDSTGVIANIPLSANANLVIDQVSANGRTRLWLFILGKGLDEVPAMRPFFDRLVAKLREAFPDNAIEEVD